MSIKQKKEKGITLVALIITIIILLILSAVVIYEITGKNKIINLAIESTQNYQASTKEEIEEFDKLNDKITSPNKSDIAELEKENNDLREENEKLKEELKKKSEMQVLVHGMERGTSKTYTFEEDYSSVVAIVAAANNNREGSGKVTPTLVNNDYQAYYNNSRVVFSGYSITGGMVVMNDVKEGDSVQLNYNYCAIYTIIGVK